MRRQCGFTLLELMVAMSIFAMLAVAGWQVFDSVNRARERAQFHADNLAVLQYAYLQLQQDMAQVIPYQAPSTQNNNTQNNSTQANRTNDSTDNNNQAGEQTNEIAPEPFMTVDSEHVSFVRFADPDPRYQSSASVQRIEYIFVDERLIRRQYMSIGGGRDSISLDSVLLEGVTLGRWQAYLPELSTEFPSDDASSGNSSNTNIALGQAANTTNSQPDVALLPKGVSVDFTYQDMPITWQWALAPQPTPYSRSQEPAEQNDSNNNESGNNGSDNGANGSDTGNGTVENAN